MTGEPRGAACPPYDELFDVLSDACRRVAISLLSNRDGPVELAALAGRIAAERIDEEPADDKVHEIHLALYHSHVPKLEDAGLVDYSQERDSVTPTARLDSVNDVMDAFVRANETAPSTGDEGPLPR